MSDTLSLEAIKTCLIMEQVNQACKTMLLVPETKLLLEQEKEQHDDNVNEIAQKLENEKKLYEEELLKKHS